MNCAAAPFTLCANEDPATLCRSVAEIHVRREKNFNSSLCVHGDSLRHSAFAFTRIAASRSHKGATIFYAYFICTDERYAFLLHTNKVYT